MTKEVGWVRCLWRIENFSSCLILTGEGLPSPAFKGGSLFRNLWGLRVYPRGRKNDKYIDFGVWKGIDENSVECEFSFLISDGSTLVCSRKTVTGGEAFFYVNGSVRREEVFGVRRNNFLPNDTLTVQCSFRKNGTTELKVNETLFARTRIGTERNCFTWGIKDFLSLHSQKEITKTVAITSKRTSNLIYKILKEDRSANTIHVNTFLTTYPIVMFVNCNILVLNNSGNWVGFAKGMGLTSSWNFELGFASNFTTKKLRMDKDIYLTNGVLNLKCEHIFCGAIVSEEIETDPTLNVSSFRNPKQCTIQTEYLENSLKGCIEDTRNSIGNDFQVVYNEGILSDFNLHVGSKKFPVHRIVLCARSPVFKAMFTVDMKERDSDCMDIPDLTAETLQRLLLFIYSDNVEKDMPLESAFKLYSAADKYAIEPLKRICSSILKASTCASNVLDFLVLADMHGDKDLKSSLYDFVVIHDKEVVGTEEWDTFEEENSRLAVQLLKYLYMKIRN